MDGCGKDQGCFRVCQFDPRCDSDTTEYMITMRATGEDDDDDDPGMIKFRMGGYLRGERDYIAVGMGMDYENMRNTDVMACTRKGTEELDAWNLLLIKKSEVEC